MKRQKGSALIELLMVLPILFVLLAAVFHIGRLVYAHQKVIIASRIAAERAASMINPSAANARGAMFYPYNYNGAPATLAIRLFFRRLANMGGDRTTPPMLAQVIDVTDMIGFQGKNPATQMARQYLAYSLGIDPSWVTVEYRAVPYIKYLRRNQNGPDSIAARRGGMDNSVGYLHPGEVPDNQVDNLTRRWWEEDAQRENSGGANDPRRITRYELPYGTWLIAAKVSVRYPVTPMTRALIGAASVLLGGIQLAHNDQVIISHLTVFPAPLSAIDIIDATQSLRLAMFDTDKDYPDDMGVINFANPPSTWDEW